MCIMLDSSVYWNSQNLINSYKSLVKITAFGFVRISSFRVDSIICPRPYIKEQVHFYAFLVQITGFSLFLIFVTAPHWYQNCTHGYPLFSPDFYQSFLTKRIKRTNLYKTSVGSLQFFKKSSKVTNHPDSHCSSTQIVCNCKISIDMISNGSDIQQISLWLIRTVDEFLPVAYHRVKCYTYISMMANNNLSLFLLDYKY